MLRIASKADSEQKFIELFSPFCQRDSFFIVTRQPKSTGTETKFSIHLKDGLPVITGTGIVEEAYADRDNPFKLPGMKLRFVELYGKSRDVVERLVAARSSSAQPASATAPGQGRPTPITTAAALARQRQVAPTRKGSEGAIAGEIKPAAPNPRQEERVKGSDFILPANPFGELTDHVLEAFVECSLYEDIATNNAEQEGGEPANLPDWWADRASLARPGTGQYGRPSTGSLMADGLAPAQVVAGAGYGRPMTPGVAAQQRAVSGVPFDAMGHSRGPMGTVARAPLAHSSSNRKMLLVAIGAAVFATVISLALGYMLWGGDSAADGRNSAAGPEETSPAESGDGSATTPQGALEKSAPAGEETASSKVTDDTAQSPEEMPGKTPPEDEDASSPESAGECEVTIASDPDGAQVALNGRVLGETPLATRLPCGTVALRFTRARRQAQEKTVTLEPEQDNRVEVRLSRPVVKLSVTSQPAGAEVKVNGKAVGKTPLTTKVTAFRTAKVEIRKSGYRTYKKSVKPTGKGGRVSGRLKKKKRRK